MRAAEFRAACRLAVCRAGRAAQRSPELSILGAFLLATCGAWKVGLLESLFNGTGAPVVIDAIFVTDCSDYQETMSQVFLAQWLRFTHTSVRLTRAISCDEDDPNLRRVLRFSEPHSAHLSLYRLPELNGQGSDRYLCNNRPRGFRRWLQDHPAESHNHWILMIDPDMLVLRPLRADQHLRLEGTALGGQSLLHLRDVPPGVGISHHFDFVPDHWRYLNLSLPELCAGNAAVLPDCETRLRDLWDNPSLIEEHYSVGVPHFIRVEDLARMAESWPIFTDQVRLQYRGWTAEMFSWILAARYAGIRFAYLAEVVSQPSSPEPAWRSIDEGSGGDACSGAPDERPGDGANAAGSPALRQPGDGPWLLHYCEIYNVTYAAKGGAGEQVETFYLDKRQVIKILREIQARRDAASRRNLSLLDCDAPVFEVPPADLLASYETGPVLPAWLFQRSAWFVCATLRIINAGLRDFRRVHCPGPLLPYETAEKFRAEPAAVRLAKLLEGGFGFTKRKPVDWEAMLSQSFNGARSGAGGTASGEAGDTASAGGATASGDGDAGIEHAPIAGSDPAAASAAPLNLV